jgi:hypothetical protein
VLGDLRAFYQRSKPFHRPRTLLFFLRAYLLHRNSFPFFSKKRKGGFLQHRKAFLEPFLPTLFRNRKGIKKVRKIIKKVRKDINRSSLLLLCSRVWRKHATSVCLPLFVLVLLYAAERRNLLPGSISFPLSFIARGFLLKHFKALAVFFPGFCRYLGAFLTLYRNRKDIKKVLERRRAYRRSLLLLWSRVWRKHAASFCFLLFVLFVLYAAQRSHLLPANISFPRFLVGLASR